jgi:hypothetical protein
VTAIFTEDDLPGEWKQFTAVNAEWFSKAVTGPRLAGWRRAGRPAGQRPSVVAGWSQAA